MMPSAQLPAASNSPSGWPAGPDAAEEVVWHVWGEAPELSVKLGRFAVTHLECEELADALLFGGQQTRHQFGFKRDVRVKFPLKGDDILYFGGVPVVLLRNHTVELGFFAADGGHGKLCVDLF
jgi:hypothetical protein